MKITKSLLNLCKSFEGYVSHIYRCPAGKQTIGYGHVVLKNDYWLLNSSGITEKVAEQLLINDLKAAAREVEEIEQYLLNQNQFDALVSFVFNIGVGKFLKSTMRKKILDYDLIGAANEFKHWNKITVNGKKRVSRGLSRRRKTEAKMFRGDDLGCCNRCIKWVPRELRKSYVNMLKSF